MIHVFLADDHSLVRSGIRRMLADEPDITVVGEASDGRRTLRALADLSLPVDVLLLDISMPYLNGIETLRRIQEVRPGLRTLIVSMYPEDQFERRLLEEGAAGYLSKHRTEDEVVAAVREVAASGSYTQRPTVVPRSEGLAALTPREHQIFTLVLSGSTVTDIAAELNLAVSTVSTHLRQVKSKLGVDSINGILTYAHRIGLIA